MLKFDIIANAWGDKFEEGYFLSPYPFLYTNKRDLVTYNSFNAVDRWYNDRHGQL